MPMQRLTYFSENQIDPGAGSVVRELGQILNVSSKNNRSANVTGALVFDNQWFIQTLEGERAAVWAAFDRIREDDRHSSVVIAEVVEINARIFANWWMGLTVREAKTETIFARFLSKGRLDPRVLPVADMLSLMKDLSKIGLQRQLVEPAVA